MRSGIVTIAFVMMATNVALAGEFPKIGAEAPSFELISDQGKATKLSDFEGKWVVLYFYPKDFTSGCTIQANAFQADIEKYRSRNAEVVGVSVDSAESHKSFCAKEGLEFRLLSDSDASVSAAYNSVMSAMKMSARNTFIIDPEGKIAKVFPSVKPVGHSAEVLAALDELAASR